MERKSGRDQADWLIGKEFMGPGAEERGFTCLRDMANPARPLPDAAAGPLFEFPDRHGPSYQQRHTEPRFLHRGKSDWGQQLGTLGQIWYKALTGFAPSPNMSMQTFANLARQLATQMDPANATVANAIDAGWTAVGL